MDDQAISWTHSYSSHEEPLVSSKGREPAEAGGTYLSADGRTQSNLSSKSKDLQDELEIFMEDVEKSADQKEELRKGFYTGGAEDLLPRHHIDEEDFKRHRTTAFPHVHHPLRIHTKALPLKRDARSSPSPRSKSKARKSAEFTPSLPEVQENNGNGKRSDSEAALSDGHTDNEAQGDAGAAELKPDILDGVDASTPNSTFEPPLASTAKKDGDGDGDSVSSFRAGFFIGEDPDEDPDDPQMAVTDPGQFNPGFPRDHGTEDLEHKGASKVSFHLGNGSDSSITGTPSTLAEGLSKGTKGPSPFSVNYSGKPYRPKHKHRRHSKASTKDLIDRRHRGSEVQLNEGLRRIPTEQDEAKLLSGLDLDEIASHRFGEAPGLRRRKHTPHSAMASIVHISKSDLKGQMDKGKEPVKRKFDHSPHELFVELDELLLGENAEFEWKEKSRWIKFEEDVEEGAERWGKPHVASLSFHSLLELRKCIEHGSILLDLEAEDLATIVTRVTEQLVIDDLLNPESKGKVISTLLLKHRHVNDGHGFLRRNFSSNSLTGMENRSGSFGSFKSSFFKRRGSTASGGQEELRRTNSTPDSNGKSDAINVVSEHGEVKIELEGVANNHVQNDEVTFSSSKQSDHLAPSTTVPANLARTMTRDALDIMKKIPVGAEATTVLVGSADFLEKPIMAFIRLSEGRQLGNLTEVPLPVRFIFILMGPSSANLEYPEIGRSISTLLANTKFHDVAYRADDRHDLLSGINEFLDDSLVMPPGYWDKATILPAVQMVREKEREKLRRKEELEAKKAGGVKATAPSDDPLRRTGRIFGGLINDIKRRYPKYLSDIKDAANFQCVATIFFIYFAALSPAVAFGGLLGEKTESYLGVSEMLIGVSISGLLFAAFGGQPILIIGFTGPNLVFEESLFQFCQNMGFEFMAFRCWVCFWVAFISLVVVALEGSFLVRYFSRFTEEIFAALISIIFIYEAFRKLYTVFRDHPLKGSYNNSVSAVDDGSQLNQSALLSNTSSGLGDNKMENQPNTALLSLILLLGTFLIAYHLKGLRNSHFLGRSVRRSIGDFGLPIAIFVMVLVDVLIDETYTEKLAVPDGIKPTNASKRDWLINPMEGDLPIWATFAAIIPAFLVFILIFMETEITGLIVNKAERKLKKGSGYHLDMFLVGLFHVYCGLFGLPTLCGATVRTVTHVSALTVFSKRVAPGEKPKLEGVIEQRVTAFVVHLLIGVSVLMGPILRKVPLTVLFGVFLYMGVASMSGVQFFDRLEMLFKPVKYHGDMSYVRRVRTSKMHLFTVLQILCLAILWTIKSTQAALSFPFMLILTVPLRKYLFPLMFTEKELHHLDRDDANEDPFDLLEDEPDFYEQAHMPY